MKLQLGQTIKNLRTQKSITQDKLAEYLDVTPQAISRWENGSGYPDIELLPGISSFFGVSLEKLLGVDASAAEQERLILHISMLLRDGKFNETLSEAKEALSKFPLNYDLMLLCVSPMMVLTKPSKNQSLTPEQEQLCIEGISMLYRVVNDCPNVSMHIMAKTLLSHLLSRINKNDEALSVVSSLPSIAFCSEYSTPLFLSADKRVDYIHSKAPMLIGLFISFLMSPHYPDKSLNNILQAIAIWDVSFEFDGLSAEMKAVDFRYMVLHLKAALFYYDERNMHDAMKHLVISADCCEKIDQFCEKLSDTNFNDVSKSAFGIIESINIPLSDISNHNASFFLYTGYLEAGRFSALSQNQEYSNVVNKLSVNAK